MSEPPWEKMYNELEQRHVALAQKVTAAAAFLDGLADDIRISDISIRTADSCRAMAKKLRGVTS